MSLRSGARKAGRQTLALFLLLVACDDTPGQWSLFVYPDARDQSNWLRTDRFKSESMCRQAGEENIAALPDPEKADYRCVKTGAPG